MASAEEAFLARKAAKKAARRAQPEEKAALGMTSLMDAITIIVTYLLKSYAVDPVVITPTAGQKVPLSVADTSIQEGMPVYVSQRAITVNEERLVELDESGGIDPSVMQGHLISPLYTVLAEESDKAKQIAEMQGKPWQGRLILVGDQNLKFNTIADVMFTAGQAQFSEFAFCVIMSNG